MAFSTLFVSAEPDCAFCAHGEPGDSLPDCQLALWPVLDSSGCLLRSRAARLLRRRGDDGLPILVLPKIHVNGDDDRHGAAILFRVNFNPGQPCATIVAVVIIV